MKENTNMAIYYTPVDELKALIRESVQQGIKEYWDESHSERFYSRKEAANILRISLPAFDKLVEEGLLNKYYSSERSHPKYKHSEVIGVPKREN